MDLKRVVEACMIVTCLGTILATVGMFVASGLDQGGSLYNTLSTTIMVFWVLFIVSMAFHPDFSKTKQNQLEAESDSSLL